MEAEMAAIRFRAQLVQFVRNLLGEHGTREDAEDIVQDVFVKLCRRDLPDDCSYNALRMAALRMVEKQVGTTLDVVPLDDAVIACPRTGDLRDPEAIVAGNQAHGRVMRAVDAVSPDMRQAFLMVEVEGCSYMEVADTLDVPRGTISSRMCRTRAVLRGNLADLR